MPELRDYQIRLIDGVARSEEEAIQMITEG
jgi:hypothetical protein